MLKKASIAYFIFFLALLYIVSPWVFEKKLLFNEMLAGLGLAALIYKGFRFGRDPVSVCMMTLLLWGGVHMVTSLFRMDAVYYYFRNSVIVYSMLSFFLGYHLYKYLPGFIERIRGLLRSYIGIFLVFPLPRTLFERFGMSMLFPALFKKAWPVYVPYLLIFVNIIYAISYESLTAMVLAMFYLFIFITPSYRAFAQVMILGILAFAVLFIYLQPNLDLIANRYTFYDYNGITDVMNSSPILSADGNSTWRLVLWKQIIVDNFPSNLFGIGFGTPALKYFPIEDYSKLETLPYVLGAHNSFFYLFGRLGVVYIILIALIYRTVFREYFNYRSYYRSNNQVLVFWSFFAITIIALFNPALESPIYAGAYWLILGFLARTIALRRYTVKPEIA